MHIGFGEGNLSIRHPLERPRLKWKDNIITDLQEVEFERKDWIPAAQDRDRWRAVVNL